MLRGFIHEYALLVYAACLLAVMTTWPALRYPMYTLPQDLGDPSRQAWQISWIGHILINDPVRLWQANAYFPATDGLAFGDSLLGYAPAGMIGTGPDAAVLRYNVLFVLAHALLVIGAYALVRQLGARRTGAAVAAVAFACAPWRLAQEGHLDVISAGGIPLALAMLARGHGYSLRHGFRAERRSAAWAIGGWLVAIWQLTLGFSLGVPFAYVLGLLLIALMFASAIHSVRGFLRYRRTRRDGRTIAALTAPVPPAGAIPAAGTPDLPAVADVLESPPRKQSWLRFFRRPVPVRRKPRWQPLIGVLLTNVNIMGATIFTAAGILIAVPYIRLDDTGSRLEEIRFFSPPVQSLLIGPAESRIWGAAHQVPRSTLAWAAEMSLLPGFVLYALALAGLFLSIWRLRHRLALLAMLAVAVVLTLGTSFFDGRWTYLPLFGHFPASFDLRVPGRLMLWVTLLLSILAAGAVDDFVRRAEHLAAQRIPPWPGPWLRLATLVPLLLVALEGWNATAHPVVPAQPAAMRTVAGPMLVLPTAELTDQTVQLWSTTKFQDMANGGGGFAAAAQNELRAKVAGFPDATSINYLDSIGVRRVLLLSDHVAGTSWEDAGDLPVDNLDIRREDVPGAVVFYLD